MAGDWIKMRADLFTHPKVVRIASALKADTLRTVGGLMSVWCLFDAHSEDGRLDGYTPEVLDAHLRWEGFAAAMIQVGWLQCDEAGGLVLPEFDTHNGQSAKRRAQDADRKRDVRKASAPEADKKRTREEKRREEKREEEKSADAPAPGGAFVQPEWIPADTWAAYLKTRTGKKAKNEPHALGLIVKDLEAFRAKGHDPVVVLNNSIKGGWAGVFEPKTAPQDIRTATVPGSGPDPELERIKAHKGAPIPAAVKEKMAALKGGVLQ